METTRTSVEINAMWDLLGDLLELVLNLLVELFFDVPVGRVPAPGTLNCSWGWRFWLPVAVSFISICIIESLSSSGDVPGMLVLGIVSAGFVGGLFWDWQANRD